MKKLLIGLLALASVSSFADTNNYYTRVKSMFENGDKPSMSEIIGVNVGRCFLRNEKHRANPFLLYTRIDNTNAGPIDDNTIVSQIRYQTSLDADYFDSLPLEQIEGIVSDLAIQPLRENEKELLVDNFVGGDRQVITLQVRKNKNFLVSRIGTFMYCYSFIKR